MVGRLSGDGSEIFSYSYAGQAGVQEKSRPQRPGRWGLSKPLASVGWQENCFREPENTKRICGSQVVSHAQI